METWQKKAKWALKAKGLRYCDLAAALDVTESAVGHYLNERREPPLESIKIIAQVVGLSLSEMCGDDPRFVTHDTEKQLLDNWRQLSDEDQKNFLSLLQALRKK